jgi:hypothetical protein
MSEFLTGLATWLVGSCTRWSCSASVKLRVNMKNVISWKVTSIIGVMSMSVAAADFRCLPIGRCRPGALEP